MILIVFDCNNSLILLNMVKNKIKLAPADEDDWFAGTEIPGYTLIWLLGVFFCSGR